MVNHIELYDSKEKAKATPSMLADGGVALHSSSPCTGLSFELKNVVFEYPGSKTNESSLKGINLVIKPNQLVIIVGGNGSGKSIIVNLLTRLYDATSGEIMLDSLPISDYSLQSLRGSMALLNQDHNIFPLSLYENVALGCPEQFENRELVEDSIRRVGADTCTGKFNKKTRHGSLSFGHRV